MQIFVRTLDSRSAPVFVEPEQSVWSLKVAVAERAGVPASVQGLVYGGKQLDDTRSLGSYGLVESCTCHLVLALRGGKGGFGALLRGQGRDGKVTTNFDACRDLSGRRVRHANAEKKLAEYQSQSKERELEKVALQHIKEVARQSRREADLKVNVEEVKEEQRNNLAKVQEAVQSAMASAAPPTKKRKLEAEPSQPAKKGGMLDMLVSSEGDSSDENDD